MMLCMARDTCNFVLPKTCTWGLHECTSFEVQEKEQELWLPQSRLASGNIIPF